MCSLPVLLGRARSREGVVSEHVGFKHTFAGFSQFLCVHSADSHSGSPFRCYHTKSKCNKDLWFFFFLKKTTATKPLISPCHYYPSRLRIPFFLPHNFYISISWCFSRKKKQTPSTVSHHWRTSFKKCGPSLFHGRKTIFIYHFMSEKMQHYQRCRILQTKDHHNVYILISLPFCCHCRFCQILHTLTNNVGQTTALSAHLPRELKEI